jgi:hypothetical protein
VSEAVVSGAQHNGQSVCHNKAARCPSLQLGVLLARTWLSDASRPNAITLPALNDVLKVTGLEKKTDQLGVMEIRTNAANTTSTSWHKMVFSYPI